ncbi:28 kDa heat- and acid-stable phosphoprotein, partial [Trichinella zimbabwensis]
LLANSNYFTVRRICCEKSCLSQIFCLGGGKKKFGHKGGARKFTSFEELKAQQEDIEKTKSFEEDDEPDKAFQKPRIPEQQNSSDSDSSDDDESDNEETKHKGVSHLIEVENPNRRVVKNKKFKNLEFNQEEVQLSRKEKEALEKEQARQRYLKLHAEGKTEEARADLARLAIIRKNREEAAKKRQEEAAAKEAASVRR